MKKALRSLAGRTLSTSTDAEEKSLAAYVLQDDETEPKRKRSTDGRAVRQSHQPETKMADAKPEDKETDPKKIDLEAAKSLVDKDREASKDGVAVERTEAGIVLSPREPDKSVVSYDGTNPQRAEQAKPEKSKYKSGEPVHDRE